MGHHVGDVRDRGHKRNDTEHLSTSVTGTHKALYPFYCSELCAFMLVLVFVFMYVTNTRWGCSG